MVKSGEFSKRLEQIMEQHELNASSFAEKIGVGRSSISHIISGRNKPSLDFILNILKAFPEVDLYWLLNGKGTYKSPTLAPQKEQVNLPIATSTDEDLFTHTTDGAFVPTAPTTNFAKNDESDVLSRNFNKGKNITRVLWFFEDGTFKEFFPSPTGNDE